MRQKTKTVIILVSMTFIFSGCESFRKKFVRKPKEKEVVNVVVRTHEYESQYTIDELYKKYYIFWSAAQKELIEVLEEDGSRKKKVFSASQILENLKHMRGYLVPEKQLQLDKFIAKQENIAKQLDVYRLSLAQKLIIKSTLETQRRLIERQFSYSNIKEYLIRK
ncbi:MAG: hypothetical protein JW869_07630 [Candidatus Omnitrophica bacterium]|nr:hypothetical protein [Candidatus Omnitrophota bacterium]